MIAELYNYLRYDDHLASSGMPKPDQIAAIAKSGAKIVINLATMKSENALTNEKELVEAQGMQYIWVPVEWENPTRKNLDDFMNAMDARKDEKVFVHCQANYRATAFIALYRVLRLDWETDRAFEDVRKIWKPSEYPVWEKFIKENIESVTPST